jgi:flagellar basal-body rod modification protein FlgD
MTTVPSATNNTAQTSTSNPLDSLSQDYTTFLKLLTTQLKNQDPLSPMDSAQFTQQLVSFAGVEQQIKANTNLQSLISLQQAGTAQQALSYLGKIAEVKGTDMPLVNGAGAFSYSLSTAASGVKIEILDSDGNVVRTVQGSTTLGKHIVTWDGTKDDGSSVPDGLYTAKITPTRTDGTAVTADQTVYGVVNSVSNDSDGTVHLSMTYLSGTPSDVISVNTSLAGSTTSIGTATNDNTDTSDDSSST